MCLEQKKNHGLQTLHYLLFLKTWLLTFSLLMQAKIWVLKPLGHDYVIWYAYVIVIIHHTRTLVFNWSCEQFQLKTSVRVRVRVTSLYFMTSSQLCISYDIFYYSWWVVLYRANLLPIKHINYHMFLGFAVYNKICFLLLELDQFFLVLGPLEVRNPCSNSFVPFLLSIYIFKNFFFLVNLLVLS